MLLIICLTSMTSMLATRPLTISFLHVNNITLTILDKGIRYWQYSLGNPTYTATTLPKEEILDNHWSVLSSFGISTLDAELDLPSLYWIPKLHKCRYKQHYIAGSANGLTKSFEIINIYSISGLPGFRITMTLATQEVVWGKCGFWTILNIC